jgi:hypothetical protein
VLTHYLVAATRALARNWLYAGITVLGLAAGFAAAILIGLYVRDEYSFERFIAGYEQIYRLETGGFQDFRAGHRRLGQPRT